MGRSITNWKTLNIKLRCIILCFIGGIFVYVFFSILVSLSLFQDKATLTKEVSLEIQSVNVNSKNHMLYSANDIALHPKYISYSYAKNWQIRQENFQQQTNEFVKLGKDLLYAKNNTFQHISKYYIHPSKYYQYTREYLLKQWVKYKQNHIHSTDLLGAHPSCPKWNLNGTSNPSTYEIHFTHNCCNVSELIHRSSAIESAHFEHSLHYTYDNISSRFKKHNKHIIYNSRGQINRGAGYWIWKPYIILDTMVNIANICDIICYADTGTRWVYSAARLFELTSLIKYGVMVFMHSIGHWDHILLTERFWSKRDAMLLLGVDINDMYDTVQRKASFMCFQINPDSIHFVSEWLYHAMDRRIITDDVNVLNMANIENYHGNRHDQTIMSLLSKKYGIPAFRDPSQYGNKDAKKFGKHVQNWNVPKFIQHTRNKN
eukprot:50840_1